MSADVYWHEFGQVCPKCSGDNVREYHDVGINTRDPMEYVVSIVIVCDCGWHQDIEHLERLKV